MSGQQEEYCYVARIDQVLKENRQLRAKGAKILDKIRKEQQSRPLRIGKR